MNPFRFLRCAATVAVLLAASPFAMANPVSGSATGLSNAGTLITFDEHVLAQDTVVTNQFADHGVTFSPRLFYSPNDPDGGYTTRFGNYLGNYADGSLPDPVEFIIGFLDLQTRAVFGMTSNGTSWRFEALLGDAVVESFDANVSDAYYGFTGLSFNRIRVTALPVGGDGDYAGIDQLQFGFGVLPAAVPEPGAFALLSLGLVALAAGRRRSRVLRAS